MKLQTRVKQMLQLHFSLAKPTAFCIFNHFLCCCPASSTEGGAGSGPPPSHRGGGARARAGGTPWHPAVDQIQQWPGGGHDTPEALCLWATRGPKWGLWWRAHCCTFGPFLSLLHTWGWALHAAGTGSAPPCRLQCPPTSLMNPRQITEPPFKSAVSVALLVITGHGSGPP